MPCDPKEPNQNPDDGEFYRGKYYAYAATGGFEFERGVGTVIITPSGEVAKYDMTNSLQVKYDVDLLNEKLGPYDDDCQQFLVDEIEITAKEFKENVISADVISVGLYKTIYQDFESLLNNYFTMPAGVTSLFVVDSNVQTDNLENYIDPDGNSAPYGNEFDSNSLISLMNYSALDSEGRYVKTISGKIQISRINAMLKYAASSNDPFNNRNESGKTEADGFVEKDLIYVPTGSTITLVANIVNSYTNMPSNFEPRTKEELDEIIKESNGKDFINGYYSQKTTFTNNSITRVVRVPLLLVLIKVNPLV